MLSNHWCEIEILWHRVYVTSSLCNIELNQHRAKLKSSWSNIELIRHRAGDIKLVTSTRRHRVGDIELVIELIPTPAEHCPSYNPVICKIPKNQSIFHGIWIDWDMSISHIPFQGICLKIIMKFQVICILPGIFREYVYSLSETGNMYNNWFF